MPRRIFDNEGHAQFVTFSCYRRRRLLDHDRTRNIVVGMLASQLSKQEGQCAGFVVMPDHVHALVRFPETEQLSRFMQQWKRRSSVQIKKVLQTVLRSYSKEIDLDDSVWQPRYYPFNVYSEEKALEKLNYMHLNPVRAGLVNETVDWRWSSARHYELGQSVGVPIRWFD